MAKRTCEACGFEDAEVDKPCTLCGAREAKKLVHVDALVTRDTRPAATPDPKREPTDSTDRLGQVFAGRYRIDALIGAGPRGEVFRARDTRDHRDVALKILHAAPDPDPNRLELFKREMASLARIKHPAVPPLLDFGLQDDELFLVSERVEGTDLQTEMKRRGPWNPVEAAALAASVADALAAAHGVGVVHRHVKPGNVMIGRDASVKLLDFGITQPGPAMVPRGTLSGAHNYRPPEEADPRGADERGDLYSLGVILFEMLTGKLPLTGATTAPARSPRDLRPDLPPWIDRVVMRCLERDPARRHRSAAELSAELRRAQGTGPHSAQTSAAPAPARASVADGGLGSRLTRWIKRR